MPRAGNVIAALGVAVVAVSCIPPPEDNDRVIDYRSDTAMGVVQDAGVLRLGVEIGSFPFVAEAGPNGFVVDYGRDIADALGVDASFAEASRDGLLAGIRDGTFDVVFPTIPITEPLARRYAVTDPYYVGHQRLLVGPGSEVGGLADLGGGRLVCVVSDPYATADLTSVLPPETVRTDSLNTCIAALSSGAAAAASGRDVVLLPFAVHAGRRLVGEEISTEGYGALVRRDPAGLAEFVNAVLAEAKAEGRWMEWYGDWFGVGPYLSEQVTATAPPDMTAEEAAALHPSEI